MTQPTTNTNESLTFEKVWNMFQESKIEHEEQWKRLQEKMDETDRMQKETDRIIKENALQMKETDRRMKETDRIIVDLGNRFGELAEHLVAPGIAEKFNELGFSFHRISPGGIEIIGDNKKIRTQIDILLENSEYIIAVEVKARPGEQDIAHHLKRLEILKESNNKDNDFKKIRGAIAGAVFKSDVKKSTLEAGLYVLEQSGDTMKIEAPDDQKVLEL